MTMEKKTMAMTEIILNANQVRVLDAMIGAALDSTAGDFGTLDEVSVPRMNKHALGAYMTQLQELGLVVVHGPVTVNQDRRGRGDTYVQYTIEPLGWTLRGYNPDTREQTTKPAISLAVNTPKGKETTMATKNTGNAAKAQSEIDKLVKRLLALKDKSDGEGRKIRRMLRKLGHKGGVRGRKPGRKPTAPKA